MMRTGQAGYRMTASVLEILGLTEVVREDEVEWSVVTSESRHSIWRFTAPAAAPGSRSYVVKSYHRDSDKYFDHRFRREERILDLAGRYAPGLSPSVHGGAIIEGHSAYLVLEDLGDRPLHVDLDGADVGRRMRQLRLAVDLLARFHRLTDEYSGIFRAVCQSSILDRVNTRTLLSRFDVACERLASNTVSRDRSGVRGEFHRSVIRPLLRGPRRVIHNSFSPLNICMLGDGSLRVLDMETVAIGPAELDLAELLIYPGPDIGTGEHELIDQYRRAISEGRTNADSARRLQMAAIVRALDYAGTLSARGIRFRKAGLDDLASAQDDRGGRYLREALDRARNIELPAKIPRWLAGLAGQSGDDR